MQLSHNVESGRVLASEESFFSALLQGDDQTLRAVLTEDFRIVDVMAGRITTRDELLDAIRSGNVKFVDVTRFPDGRSVRHREGLAVVVGRTEMTMEFQGNEATVTSRYTHVFVREGGSWRLLSAQGTKIDGSDVRNS